MPSFIAGPYTATWNALALGQSAEGWRVSHSFFKRLITGDSFAQSPQDEVYQGAEMFVNFRLTQYDAAAVQTVMWPFGAYLTMGQVGRVSAQQSIAQSLVFTAVAGTPAATVPATLTLTKTIIAEGHPVDLLLAPDLREVPLRLRSFPNASGVFGSVT
jgi:hypothetical protein